MGVPEDSSLDGGGPTSAAENADVPPAMDVDEGDDNDDEEMLTPRRPSPSPSPPPSAPAATEGVEDENANGERGDGGSEGSDMDDESLEIPHAPRDETVERLASLAGVRPSAEWLDACRSHVRSQRRRNRREGRGGGGGGTGTEEEEDEVLHQILHADLRDVVRSLDRRRRPPPPRAGEPPLPSVRLREAIETSSHSPQRGQPQDGGGAPPPPCKAVLPESFRLLVQAEETLDVSLNAEMRLALGPASPSSPTPVGNQRKRCLKMVVSDGYYADGLPYENDDDGDDDDDAAARNAGPPNLLIATETSPIPSLSVHSKPGIKLLLTGPITIRLGLLMLNEGNTIVLGGCIPELIPVQKKAMELAKRVAGVGVDPTVRALIWNPHTGAEEEEDEGERESTDVPPAAPAVPMAGPQRPDGAPPARVHRVTPAPDAPTAAAAPPPPSRPADRATHPPRGPTRPSPPAPSPRPATSPSRGVATSAGGGSPWRRQPSNPYSTGGAGGGGGGGGVARPPAAAAVNPYASFRTARAPPSSSSSTLRSAAAGSSHATPKPSTRREGMADTPVDLTSPDEGAPNAPLATTTTAAASTGNSSTAAAASSTESQQVGSSQDSSNSGRSSSRDPASSSSAVLTPPQHPPAGPVEHLSFKEMKSLLRRLRVDRELYAQHEGKTFCIQARMRGNLLGFNVEKIKKSKRRVGSKLSSSAKKEKYEYIMICRFGGSIDSEGTITCKIASSILEPYFGVPPGEMRRLNRIDKAKSNALAGEGGKRVVAELKVLSSLHVVLLLPTDAFFGAVGEVPEVDGDSPVLLVIGRGNA